MNQPLRILHVISRLDGYGGARTLRQLAVRQAAAGQEPIIAAMQTDVGIVDELRRGGVTVHEMGARWRFDPLAMHRLRQLSRRLSANLTHAWDADVLLYASLAVWRETLVAAWNDSGAVPPWITRLTGRSAALLPPAVDVVALSPLTRAAALAELEVPPDARVIAVAGPLTRAKELDDAIWCFELVRVLHPTARLVIFGDGPDRMRLERYANLVSEPGCVVFAGYSADLAMLLPHADVFWQLDPAQGAPHALLEALAAGVPAVASDVPAHQAAIINGETGLLVTPRNRADVARATDRLLSDASLARRIGDAGAIAVRNQWPMENCVAACEALYRAVTPGH